MHLIIINLLKLRMKTKNITDGRLSGKEFHDI